MSQVAGMWSLCRLAVKRLWSDPGLTAGILLGLVTTVALATSAPMYVEAANNVILRRELGEIEARGSPAFAFMYHVAYPGVAIRMEDLQAADAYLARQVPALFRLPLDESTLSVQSVRLGLYPAAGEHYGSTRRPLGHMKVGFVRGLSGHAQVVEGEWPEVAPDAQAAPSVPVEPVQVLMAQGKVRDLGVQVGEEYVLFRDSEQLGRIQVPIQIAGIWIPNDPDERFWFVSPDVYEDVLLLPEASYERLIPGEESWSLDYIAWYQVYDGSKVTAEDVPAFLAHMRRVAVTLKGIISSIGVPVSPEWALVRYEKDVTVQGTLLLTFGIPVIAAVLVFTASISATSVRRRNGEIALLRSRGTNVAQVLVLCLFQGLILGLVSLVLGLLAGRHVARLLGNTRAFLSFESDVFPWASILSKIGLVRPLQEIPRVSDRLYPVVTRSSLRVGVVVTGLATVFYLLPTLHSVRLTVVTFLQNAVRAVGRPWWQRSFLDVILFAIAGYGYYLQRGERSLSFLMGGQGGDPLEQPLVLITPSLYLLVGVLFFLRLAPHLLNLAAWLIGYLPGTVLVLTLRHLARHAKGYSGVFLLLSYSISLSLFTASMAWTLDKNLEDRAYYDVGSDLSLQERGWGSQELAEGTAEDVGGGATAGSSDDQPGSVLIIPTDDALRVEGIEGATRVYRFSVRVRLAEWAGSGTLVGIDRLSFPGGAFFRSDFAPRSLGELMNILALDRRGVLVDRNTLVRHRLDVGDPIRVQLSTTEAQRIDFYIAGALDLFPTVRRSEFPVFVGSADYILEQLGALTPGELWLAVHPSIDAQSVLDQLHGVGFRVSSMEDARALIAKEQGRLLRVGLFGFLSVGFVAMSILSSLSLIIYSFTFFQQRTIQFGILQAIGLTKAQLEWVFMLEQFVIIVLSTIVGTVLGLYGCRLFLPFFQVSYDSTFPLPPPLIVVAWRDIWKVYVVLGITHLVLSAFALRMLNRLRIFETIKLGAQLAG
jgi:putative ABC transport system permease protein